MKTFKIVQLEKKKYVVYKKWLGFYFVLTGMTLLDDCRVVMCKSVRKAEKNIHRMFDGCQIQIEVCGPMERVNSIYKVEILKMALFIAAFVCLVFMLAVKL